MSRQTTRATARRSPAVRDGPCGTWALRAHANSAWTTIGGRVNGRFQGPVQPNTRRFSKRARDDMENCGFCRTAALWSPRGNVRMLNFVCVDGLRGVCIREIAHLQCLASAPAKKSGSLRSSRQAETCSLYARLHHAPLSILVHGIIGSRPAPPPAGETCYTTRYAVACVQEATMSDNSAVRRPYARVLLALRTRNSTECVDCKQVRCVPSSHGETERAAS
ncbi:hypothetical protein OH77DRAFT_1174153 [Trametes cingulata]|nr:hypothetical protein OH77DRAFT_1174153 [Trametes cingulata]